jgi:Hemerythrin HHE cation binding domain
MNGVLAGTPRASVAMEGEVTMNDHLWSVPAHGLDAGAARRSILAQHAQIKRLLKKAQDVARDRLEGRAQPMDAVASAIVDVRTIMEVHLSFEEKVLVPLLEADLPLGPERARRMLDEHKHQRAMLASLHGEAAKDPALPALSLKLEFLTATLLEDMDHEEHDLLIPEVIRDDQVTVDQSSG